MPEYHPLERVLNKIEGAFTLSLDKAKKSNPVPLGEERLTTKEFSSRFADMSVEERQKLIRQKGADVLLKQLRGNQ